MEQFGGHAQAIGLTVATDRLEELRSAWEAAGADWPEELLVRRVEYELHLAPGEVSPRLLSQLAALEPFGQGNPRPLRAHRPAADRGGAARFRQRPSLGAGSRGRRRRRWSW